MNKPVNVSITGAAGNIAYSAIFRIASGQMLGNDQPINLKLIDIEPAMNALKGVKFELEDCAFPLLNSITVTHDLDEAVRVGHRIAIMRDGEVVQIGTPEEIVVNPSDEYVADFVKGISRLKVVQAKTIMQSIEEYKKTFGDNLINNERVNENDILSKLIETSVSQDKPIVVTNNDNLEIGIITQSDLLKAVVEGNDSE